MGFLIFAPFFNKTMNKFFFALLIIASSSSISLCNNSFLLVDNDTLNKNYFDSLSYSLYSSPGGGFVSGNNAYLDRAKAQEFKAGNPCIIYGVFIHFGFKSFVSLSDSSYVGLNFYQINNSGRNTLVTNAPCPGTLFFKDSIKVSEIDTMNGNILSYSNPIFTDSNFAIGIDFDQLRSTDTVALFTNKDGDAGTREESWEQDASGNWFTLKYNWPLNVDYAIFPIVNTSVGLEVIKSQNQAPVLSPNPTSNGKVNIAISKSLIKHISVFNSNFQLVNSNSIFVDDSNITVQLEVQSKGIYFVEIQTKNSTIIEKLLVE